VEAADSDQSSGGVGGAAHDAMRYVLALFMPLAVLAAALAPWVVDVAYVRGEFDAEAASGTSQVVAAFAPLVVLTLVQGILVSAHNARRAGLLLMVVGFANAILNISLNVVFGLWLGVAGVALSTSVTTLLLLLVLGERLARLDGDFKAFELIGLTGRALIASLVPGAVCALIAWGRPAPANVVVTLVALAGLAIAALASYVAVARAVGVHEPYAVVSSVGRSVRSRWAAA
jgi:putative peptidoglycan lipid II flippase